MILNTIIQGDALTILKTLPDESVNCCVTSPPYWGLRDYGTAKWEGGDSGCTHKKGDEKARSRSTSTIGFAESQGHNLESWGEVCGKCGAVRVDKQLGLEKTPEEYVSKMVDIFREVRRVLRGDGTLWLNIGDTYASGKGTCFKPGGGETSLGQGRKAEGAHPLDRGNKSTMAQSGLKPKDLCMIPARVALALQADGWWVRSDIIWHKPNPMPESVTDRPTKAHEYIFLMSKSVKYYYDTEAVAGESATVPHSPGWVGRNVNNSASLGSERLTSDGSSCSQYAEPQRIWGTPKNGKANRNKRSVWTVCTQPYPEAHFATFPEKLIEPCILAGCPERGIVLDPFLGSGTTAAVALRLNRQFVGIELNPEYIELAEKRMQQKRLAV